MAFYTHVSYAQYRALVLARLMDAGAPALATSPANVRYSDTEVKRLSLETFRTWQSTAWAVRDRGQFPTVSGQVFYDLPMTLVGGSITLNANPPVQSNFLGYTLLDQDLLQDIQIALMEPLSANSWPGSEQFTLQDVQDALEKVRNKFLFETGMVVTHFTGNATPGDGRVGLPDNVVHIRRIAYQPNFPANSPFVPLFRSDEWASDAFNAGWNTTPDTPLEYSIIDSPKVRVQLMPSPALVGNLDILAVQTPGNLNLAGGVLLNIPDDLAWVVKYGALHDLLTRSGEATDAARAAYCKSRYDQGIGIAKLWNTIQQPAINGISLLTNSIQEMDWGNYFWQTTDPAKNGQPTDIITVSPNLIALSLIPDAGPYSVQMDVLRNFPIPVNDTDFIQVGREELNTLVDFTVHLALFKEGGQEFADTLPLAQNMLTLAKQYNGTLAAEAPDLFKIARQSITVSMQKPTGVEVAV